MARSDAHTVNVVIACLVIPAAVSALRTGSPGWSESGSVDGLKQAGEGERFVARFDSLSRVRLYPTVQHSRVFAKSLFDEDRKE